MCKATFFTVMLPAAAVGCWVAVTSAQAGSLFGAARSVPATPIVNLTAGGVIDWAHWGVSNPASFTHKAGVTPQISNATVIGALRPQMFDNNFNGYSWTNGTPIQKSAGTKRGIYIEGKGRGFELSVPADTSPKTLTVYAGSYFAQMHFEAALSNNSAPGYTNQTFLNTSDGPNRSFSLNFAASSANQKLVVRFWSMSTAGNVTLLAATLREAAPLVQLSKPANGSTFHPASDGLELRASTSSPFSLPENQIRLLLNDQDVSAELVVGGTSTTRTARYSKLEPNRLYRAQMSVVDSSGIGSTNVAVFDTFSSGGAVVIEAEDYNYAGGSFFEPPTLNAYQGQRGLSGVDFSMTAAGANLYRAGDPVGIEAARDLLRKAHADAGRADFQVHGLLTGDWLNYTRIVPSGRYNVYLRYAGNADGPILQVNRVSSDASGPNQSIQSIGALDLPKTGDEPIFGYAVLADALGRPVAVNLAGTETLRLTRSDSASASSLGMQLNYLVLAPASSLPVAPNLTIAASGNDVTVIFLTEVGFSYIVEFKNQLSNAEWQGIAPTMTGDGMTRIASQPRPEAGRFYRVRVQPVP